MPDIVNSSGPSGSTVAATASAAHISALKDVVRSTRELDADAPVLKG